MGHATKASKPKSAKAGVGSCEWRGSTLYYCEAVGCTYNSEDQAFTAAHVAAGKHVIPGAANDLAVEIEDEEVVIDNG